MQKINFIILVMSFLFNICVFAETQTYTQDKTAFTISAQDKEFVIKLKSNPTTGYTWFLTDYNSALLEPVKHVFEPATNKKLIGAPGYELWIFRAKPAAFVVPQQTLIRFVYSRPWEKLDQGQVETFRITTR